MMTINKLKRALRRLWDRLTGRPRTPSEKPKRSRKKYKSSVKQRKANREWMRRYRAAKQAKAEAPEIKETDE